MPVTPRPTLLFALAALLAVPVSAEVTGEVRTGEGKAVAGARVEWLAGEAPAAPAEVAVTDGRGRFELSEATPPGLVRVVHPRFEDAVVEVAAEAGPEAAPRRVEVTLVPKQQVFEEIVVSGTRGGDTFSPGSLSSTVITPEETVEQPSTLVEVIHNVPGVAENGQGGVFQVFSIRGTSRQRVLTLIEGMQVTSERRAGVSASFIDPLLMGSVDLLRGPASSYYGSGALGGVVQVFPRAYEALDVSLGWTSRGDETHQVVGWGRRDAGGDGGWSLGLAHRRADDAEDPEGGRIHSQFEQTSLTLRRNWGSERRRWDVLVLGGFGRDLGKANTDFPERRTDYPQENHVLAKLSLETSAGWRADLWIHPHDLETLTVRTSGRRDLVDNDTFDLGGQVERELFAGSRISARVGVDWFGRRSVDAVETESRTGEEAVTVSTLADAEQDEVAVYGSVDLPVGKARLTTGGRFTWLEQENGAPGAPGAAGSRDDSAASAFAGAVVPLGGGFELIANVGTGLRFPTLSERFFTGTTGRGEILGALGLEPERSLNVDAGVRYFGAKLFAEVDVFRNRIDDYIERIEIEPDVLSFVNLDSGTLEGIEFEGFYALTPELRIEWGGHWIDGEDDTTGEPLADVPAARAFAGLRTSAAAYGPWGFSVRLEQRASADDPGPGEQAIPEATILAASLSYRLFEDLSLTLSGGNLLDETYFNSADDKVTLAAERSVGVALSWGR